VINFRFHLVSLVAVFLALALGVVMGSTVIDRAIVDRLSSQIRAVEKRSDARRDENLQLKARMGNLEAFVDQALPQLVGQRLQGVTVTMVAVRGVDGESVRSAVDTLRAAGASVAGVMWIEPSFAVLDSEAQARLGEAMGEPGDQGTGLRQAAVEALGRRLAVGPGPTSAARPVASGAQELLTALAGGGFVSFDTVGGPPVSLSGWPEAGSRLLVIDGSQGKVETGVASLPLVRAAAGTGAAVALAEVFRPTDTVKARGAVVQGVRNDRDLGTRVATVDDLEEARGRAALAFAVDDLGRGRAGHYGEGPGATRQLPEPSAAGGRSGAVTAAIPKP
jgi:Copper transport outer membrane protein, MctB